MKRFFSVLLCITFIIAFIPFEIAMAREGDAGYEGGISSGEALGKTSFEYQELCFITGKPIVLKGTLVIKKSLKQGKISSAYTYNLKNTDSGATLKRTLSFTTTLNTKGNGQIIEETVYTKSPSETITIGSQSYTLRNADAANFTRTRLVDPKPAINYYAGNIWRKKVYQTGTATNGGIVVLEATGDFYGYDQYWGNVEVEVLNYTISSEKNSGGKLEKWGGTARVSISSSVSRQMKYYKNQPNEISFDGGYVMTQYNNNILDYECLLPEFDSKGNATDKIVQKTGNLKIETFPVQKRLPAVDLSNLRGHWSENNVKLLYGLEIFNGNSKNFKPEQTISRAEFTAAIVMAAREVPPDPALTAKLTSNQAAKKQTVVSPFNDVSIDNSYFNQIFDAYKRGLVSGKSNSLFKPNEGITMADAIVIFINAVGLESLAPSTAPVTTFKDNDLIPSSSRKAVYVAQKIGLVVGDEKGYLKPNMKLTKAQAASMLIKFITYMQDGIKKEYRDRIINY